MNCERCGHEHDAALHSYRAECIANLRADLAEARADLAEADREDEAREQFDTAIRESTNAMMREALGPEMYSRLWGVELERLGYACDRLRADLARCNADGSTIENHMRERLAGLEADLEAERAHHWQTATTLYEERLMARGAITGLYEDREKAEECAARAEAMCAAMRVALQVGADFVRHGAPNTHFLEWAEHAHATLTTDAGRDLLTAVRRLCEVAQRAAYKLRVEAQREGLDDPAEGEALTDALADPALAGLLHSGQAQK